MSKFQVDIIRLYVFCALHNSFHNSMRKQARRSEKRKERNFKKTKEHVYYA